MSVVQKVGSGSRGGGRVGGCGGSSSGSGSVVSSASVTTAELQVRVKGKLSRCYSFWCGGGSDNNGGCGRLKGGTASAAAMAVAAEVAVVQPPALLLHLALTVWAYMATEEVVTAAVAWRKASIGGGGG